MALPRPGAERQSRARTAAVRGAVPPPGRHGYSIIPRRIA